MKRIYLLLALILSVLPSCIENQAATAPDTQIQIVRGPYLQLVTHNSITVRWRTKSPSPSMVKYGKTLFYDQVSALNDSTTEHIVQLTELKPATRYYYAIGDASEILY